MEATVFAGYEVSIDLSTLNEVTENHSVGVSDTISIDNIGNNKQYPYLEITADDTVVLSGIICGEQGIATSITITSTDTLILDFKNQLYTLNGTSIIEDIIFTTEDRLFLIQNNITDIIFDIDNPINLLIKYDSYQGTIQRDFVRDFRISIDNSFIEDRKFKSKSINKLIESTNNFNVSFSNLAYNWEIAEAIENGNPIKISYIEDHTNGTKTFNKSLLGVRFNTYERFYRKPDGILYESLTGQGTKLI